MNRGTIQRFSPLDSGAPSTMSSRAADALAEVKQLLTRANSQSTAEARRRFYEKLISICAYPSYECKAFFGTLVAKHFREFDDLQDKAIDAILDLCEDEEEKVRIIGIKGLGATAKADSRWVRGNAGVLLQLLECPPRELRLIHEQIFTLLSISPNDVFAVALDDIRANEETGASRQNIINFLSRDAKPKLDSLLSEGDHQDAEEMLQNGLEDVCATASGEDKEAILNLMGSLPRISGPRASSSAVRRFVKFVTRSVKAGSSVDKTAPIVKVFAGFAKRAPSDLDAVEALAFPADHGTAMISLSLEKRDESAMTILDKTVRWIALAGKYLAGKDGQGLAADIAEAYLRGLKYFAQDHRSYFDHDESSAIEKILYTLYELFRLRDTRNKLIQKAHANALLDLADDARRKQRDIRDPGHIVQLESVTQLAKLIEDDRRSLPVTYTPSWVGLHRAQPPSDPTLSTQPDKTSSGRNESALSSHGRDTPIDAPASVVPIVGSQSSPAPTKLEPPKVVPRARAEQFGASKSNVPELPQAVPLTAAAPAEQQPKTTTDIKPASKGSQRGQELLSRPSSLAPASSEVPAEAPAASGSSNPLVPLSNPLPLFQRTKGAAASRDRFEIASGASYHGTELLPGLVSSSGVAEQSPAASQSLEPHGVGLAAPTRSLADRLSLPPAKREREDGAAASTPTHRSLLDRMSSSASTKSPIDESRAPKRAKANTESPVPSASTSRSLLSRMSQNDMTPTSSVSSTLPAKPSLSIRRDPETKVTLGLCQPLAQRNQPSRNRRRTHSCLCKPSLQA
ncbi:hypothetical protein BD324DRAFT_346271 [Kockovaella imperatae]|uniref:Apoptosis inhibitory protein 5-domain-containing protein n=1 Tax=Kockovaella imperatae TaxID=4999 RepID=A0A1Y1UJV9_9TREE|nr:hypothetical protein BD324DRAFT_346271 [Kockovaella imperatae]ORX38269.1 hypothetical protein BD324DRAFT_346271 [Kockovaella imperatae]